MSNVNLKTDFKNGDKLYAEQLNNNFELIKEAFAKGATGDVVWQDGTTVKFRRYVTTDIQQLPILHGAIIYDIQKGRNYIDYDGKRIQVGSAGNEVIVGEASEITEDTKLIIEQDFIDNIGSEVVNSLEGNETNKAPSVSVVNKALEKKKDIYTNEEVEIGTWIDGKPLYGKTIIMHDNIVSSSNNIFPHNIENAKLVMIRNAYTYEPNNGKCVPLPVTLYDSSTNEDKLSISCDRTNIRFNVASGWGTGWYKIVILEYTKTTD